MVFIRVLFYLFVVFVPAFVFSQNKTFLEQPKSSPVTPTELAYVAGGCFWCVEADFEKLPGVLSVTSGYMGGRLKNPSYKQVSSGKTRHLEAVEIRYNPEKLSYQKLLEHFWRHVDPTDSKGQFADRGYQYTTAIFYRNSKEKKIAEESKKALQDSKVFKKKIVTPIVKASKFYDAEDYHQNYYKKSSIKYKFYRYRSGRDQFLEKAWSKKSR